MLIGALRHLLTLQTQTRASDGQGGYTETWAALSPATAWAAVQPATARDLEERVGKGIEASLSHLVTLRYRGDVTTGMRAVLDGTRHLYVRGVSTIDEADRWTVLACEELLS